MLGPIMNITIYQTKSLVHKCPLANKVYYTDAENTTLLVVKLYVVLWVQVVLNVHLLKDFDIVCELWNRCDVTLVKREKPMLAKTQNTLILKNLNVVQA